MNHKHIYFRIIVRMIIVFDDVAYSSFLSMFLLNSANIVTKIFVITAKGLKRFTSYIRHQDAAICNMHVRGRILKLGPICDSVIHWIH